MSTSTNYALRFHADALKEWNKLAGAIQLQFLNKLDDRLVQPRIPSAAISGAKDCYKIKLRKAGMRLVYRVDDKVVVVTVLSFGNRDKNEAYRTALLRIHD